MADLRRLFDELVRFETELWNGIDARLRADHDVTLATLEFLQVIARTPQCRVNDIADALSITVGGTSKLVDRMVASGTCRRRPNPDDGRSSFIELTAAGKRVLVTVSSTFDDELARRFVGAVSERSLQQLTTTLIRLRAAGAALDSEGPS